MSSAMGSLRDIFLLWHPQTAASFDERMEALGAIRGSQAEVGWRLLLSILPKRHDVATPTSVPLWRAWAPQSRKALTYEELGRQIEVVVEHLLEEVGNDAGRWRDLVAIIDQLPPAQFEAVSHAIATADLESLSSSERRELRDSLGSVISHHLEFSQAEWALPQERLRGLQEVYGRLAPEDPVERVVWLFEGMPRFPIEAPRDGRERDEAIEQARSQAVRDLLHDGGLVELYRLATAAKDPWSVGTALAQSDVEIDVGRFLIETLGTESQALQQLGWGYVRLLSIGGGPEWVRQVLESPESRNWNSTLKGRVLAAAPFNRATWDLLRTEEASVKASYWQTVGPFGHGQMESADVERAASGFLAYSRPAEAVHLIALYPHGVSPGLIVEALEQLAAHATTSDVNWNDMSYRIGELLNSVAAAEGVDSDVIARLEWLYLPLLTGPGRAHEPRVLHQKLASDPGFFIEVLSAVYRPEGSPKTEPTEQARRRAEQGFELLHYWRQIPGEANGAIAADQLRAWISKARDLARGAGLGAVTDVHIGTILAQSPEDPDDTWPAEAVRNAIEEFGTDELASGFTSGVFNRRGVTTRAIAEGGSQERVLADRYDAYAENVTPRWPKTARLLHGIADMFRAEGAREDERAQLEREVLE